VRRVTVDQLRPDQLLGRRIYNERGDILLEAGVSLTPAYISLLKEHGVSVVYVRELGDDDVEPVDIVSEHVRTTAIGLVHRFFEVAAQATADLQGKDADDVMRGLQDGGSAATAAAYDDLYQGIQDIVDEIMRADTLPGLTSLKTYDNYTFCHSVDVAFAALLLGKKLFLPRDQLKTLGVGCLVHDIGKIFIERQVVTKPGKLSPEEYALIQQHPTLGYELLRKQFGGDVLPKHVAFQHHEHQDGSGYPRQLHGPNRIARDDRARYTGDQIMLVAEIAAVADVYDALASDRPYRAGLPAEQIVGIMRGMRATHLNAEVLDTFLSVLPRYPVGVDCLVTAGHYQGARGVVLQTHRRSLDQPTIRLVFDPAGARLSPPIEIDLGDDPTTTITCLLPDPAL
jgi:HD-GYP domain-containing protein (c-di-GMP phosphodiesterase class II)